MSITDKWTSENYLKHVVDNKLDIIWTGYCNPKGNQGIRLTAYNPIFPEDGNISGFEKKCEKKGCSGKMIIPLDDVVRRVIYKRKCNGLVNGSACGAYQSILYRWVAVNDKRKLHFDNVNIVRHYAELGRAFYATNVLYDHKIVSPREAYVDERLVLGATLTMDIDIKYGTICEAKNKENLGLALDIIRDELSTICPNSYCLQTSGNGIYVFLNHLLCDMNVFETMGMFNAYIMYLNEILKQKGVKGIKIDPINMPSRVFKLIGSIHQTKDLVCIPLEHDVRLNSVSSDEFKLKNFNIQKYIDTGTGKLNFYNRFKVEDKLGLYKFLREETFVNPDFRDMGHVVSYDYREATEAITGEEQIILGEKDEKGEKGESEKESEIVKDEKQARIFFQEFVGWKEVEAGPGRGHYRKAPDGYIEAEFMGVEKEIADNIVGGIIEKVANKKENKDEIGIVKAWEQN